MDKTAIQTSVPFSPPPAPSAPAKPRPAPVRGIAYWIKKGLSALASLRLTVFLFVLALVIVFAGTLAEVDNGLQTVLAKYFRSFFVWIPLDLFSRHWFHLPGSLPFPGGWAVGSALMFNLLAAHLVRFKLSWKRAGIMLLHSGIGVLFVGEFVAGVKQVEGHLTVQEGQTVNYLEQSDSTELAVIDPSDPSKDKVVVVPGSILRKGGTVSDSRLPFDIDVVKYMVNSDYPAEAPKGVKPGGAANPANAGDGVELVTTERPESKGTESAADFASAYLTFTDKESHKDLGTYLATVWFSGAVLSRVDLPDLPQRVRVGDKRYDVSLRFKRTYKPYSVYLYKFEHDKYPGTTIPKNYASTVRVDDPQGKDPRDNVQISMNAPLRYRGETFYQSGFLEAGRRGTVLQVVRNPGWQLPYWACGMVAAGMLMHFGVGLYGFLQRRAAR
ncbi:MAG TPA: cytochrome c biogenesis protein ResB [Gemmataceae bacterium]|nr:cytochrome c biogenesis protein ResB [Gemmataceae bacterium]